VTEEVPWLEVATTAEEDRQSATTRRSNFFKEEDLNLETAPNWSCSLELPGPFREGLNVNKSLGNHQQSL